MSMPADQLEVKKGSGEVQKYPTIFERLAPTRLGDGYRFWAVVYLMIVAATLIIAQSLDDATAQKDFRGLCIFQAAGIVIVPLAIRSGYRVLRRWAPRIETFLVSDKIDLPEWFARELSPIRGSWEMGVSAVSLAVVAVLAYYSGDYFISYKDNLAIVFAGIVIFVSAAFAGAGLYAMFLTSRAFWRLGRLPDPEIRVHRHPFGVLSTGSTLFKCWFLIGAVWAVYVMSAVVGKSGGNVSQWLSAPPMWLLAYPTFPLIVGTFVGSQIPLHEKMVAFKCAELARIDRLLDDIKKPTSLNQLDSEVRDNTEFLERQKQSLRTLPEWPFSLRSLVGTGMTAVTAMLPIFASEAIEYWRLSGGG